MIVSYTKVSYSEFEVVKVDGSLKVPCTILRNEIVPVNINGIVRQNRPDTHLIFLPRKINALGILSVSVKNIFNLAFILTLCSY